jgi:hypothetical protein
MKLMRYFMVTKLFSEVLKEIEIDNTYSLSSWTYRF